MLSIPLGYNLLTRAVMATGIVLTGWTLLTQTGYAVAAAPAAYNSDLAAQDTGASAAQPKRTKPAVAQRKRTSHTASQPSTQSSNFTVTPTVLTDTSREPLAVEKRSPSPRDLPTQTLGANRLDWRLIESFTSNALLLDENEVKQAGRVIQTVKGDLLIKPGDLFFCQAPGSKIGDRVALVHPGQSFKSTSKRTDQGFAAERLGQAKVVQAGPVATLELLSSRQEILPGTWVVNYPEDNYTTLDTSPAPAGIKGEVIGVIGNHPVGVTNSVIAIALDETTGLERGHLISIVSPSTTVPVPTQFDAEPTSLLNRAAQTTVTLPSTELAKAVVLSIKGKTALAFITEAHTPVLAGAPVRSSATQTDQASVL